MSPQCRQPTCGSPRAAGKARTCITLVWKYMAHCSLVLLCCQAMYSSTRACRCESAGYQWSGTGYSRHRYRSIDTLPTDADRGQVTGARADINHRAPSADQHRRTSIGTPSNSCQPTHKSLLAYVLCNMDVLFAWYEVNSRVVPWLMTVVMGSAKTMSNYQTYLSVSLKPSLLMAGTSPNGFTSAKYFSDRCSPMTTNNRRLVLMQTTQD